MVQLRKKNKKMPVGWKEPLRQSERAVKRRTTGLGFDVLETVEEQETADHDISDARRFAGRPDY